MTAQREPLQIGESDLDTYRKDGVVALRGAFDAEWIKLLGKGIDADLDQPSPNFVRHTKDLNAPAYFEDFWCWEHFAEFEDFVRNSPCGSLAAQLLQSQSVNLVMDNWFMREAGSKSRAPFHQDLAYFRFRWRHDSALAAAGACVETKRHRLGKRLSPVGQTVHARPFQGRSSH